MRKVLLGCALLLASAAAALAQAQGPTATMLPHPTPDRAAPGDAQQYSRTLTGKVSEVVDEGKAIVVNWADGTHSKYFIGEKTRLRADKDTPLAGRKDLTLADYRPGQTVTLTLRNSDRQVLEVRLRHAKD